MSRKSPTFYVLHGDDEFSIKARVNDFRRQMGDDLNISEFDGSKSSVAEILAAAQAMPFLSDRRLVLVSGMLSYLARKGASQDSKDQLKRLIVELPQLPESARLVFIESQTLSENHPVLNLIKEDPAGYVKAFNPPKNPTAWITNQAKAYEVEIEPRAAAALASVTSEDLRKADNELFKLASYIGTGGKITEKDVALLTPYVAETNIFDMVDALARRDGKTAMTLLHKLIDTDKQEPMQIFSLIIRQFRLLIQAREVVENGGNSKVIAKSLNVHSFVGEKLASQVRGFTMPQLERIYRNLLETDLAFKTGKVEIEVGLDLFVAGVTGGA